VSAFPRRRSIAHALRQLGSRLVESPDLDGMARLLTSRLPEVLGVSEVTLLIWDRKLESFQALTSTETRRRAWRPGEPIPSAPATRWLLSEGTVLEIPGGEGDGVLVPLLARSGLVGMLVLGGRPGRRRGAPFRAGEARLLSDLAARAALSLENHLYQQEVIASERMAALGTMAGMLAHDFRGPMTVIRGYAELLRAAATDETARFRTARILDGVDRLERMTAETLDFVRGAGRVARRNVKVAEMVSQLVDAVAGEHPTLEMERDIALDPGLVGGVDVDKLRRVLGNLAGNARDAMGGTGRLHLRARVLPPGDGSHDDMSRWPRLELVVGDEGPGVPEEIREQLFEPFVTRGKKSGTGLGLAVARRFVEDHGGTIELLPGGPGARFRLQIPLRCGADAVRM
jgi:signal transduction histidine kinase